MVVIVLKAMRLHWLKIKVVRPHWSKIKVQFLGQQRNGIPVVAYIDFSHLKTDTSRSAIRVIKLLQTIAEMLIVVANSKVILLGNL